MRCSPNYRPRHHAPPYRRVLHAELIHQLHLLIGPRVELTADLRRLGGLFRQGLGHTEDGRDVAIERWRRLYTFP